jgi:hypothetical protein
VSERTLADIYQEIYDRDGELDPERIEKEVSADAEHPLRSHLEWDDTEAARRYRVQQIQGHIRSIKITVVTDSPGGTVALRTRRFLPQEDGALGRGVARGYVELERLTPVARGQLKEEIRRDLRALLRKAAQVDEFWDLLAEVVREERGEAAA